MTQAAPPPPARREALRRASVLNAQNQTHDVPNAFVTDGACSCR